MSNKKANITLAILSVMLVATWVWFFVSKKEVAAPVNISPVQTTEVAK